MTNFQDLLNQLFQRPMTISAPAVRVSLGIASNFADVYAFLQFARGYLV